MTATTEPVVLERKVAGVGTIQFEEGVKRDGKPYRNYWLLKDGNTRRRAGALFTPSWKRL